MEELAETTTFAKEKSKKQQAVGGINKVTAPDRVNQVLRLIALGQGALTNEQLQQLKQLVIAEMPMSLH